MTFFTGIIEIYNNIAILNAKLNFLVLNLRTLREIRILSAVSLLIATTFLLLNMFSCTPGPLHGLDLVHRHVTNGKSIVTLHFGVFTYCLDEHCFPPKHFYTIDDDKILAQIKNAPQIIRFATVVNAGAFACAVSAFLSGFSWDLPAKVFVRFGAGFASAAFLFDIIFSKHNPGGGRGYGFVFTTVAMIILLIFAIIPVLFIAGPMGRVQELSPELIMSWLRELEDHLHIKLDDLFDGLRGLMNETDLEYQRGEAQRDLINQFKSYRQNFKEGKWKQREITYDSEKD